MTNPRLTIEAQHVVSVELTIDQLAEMIVNLTSGEQAQLISQISEYAADFNIGTQIRAIAIEPWLTDGGRFLMSILGINAYFKE